MPYPLDPPDRQAGQLRLQRVHEVGCARGGYEHAAQCVAHLAAVGEAGHPDGRRRGGRVGIVEHDGGRLAAELEGDLPESGGARERHLAARGGRPGEGHLVHVGMRDQVGAGGAIAGDHVDHAGRQPGRRDDLGEQQGVERRLRCGLEHDGAAGEQRGDDLADGEELGHVPWHDGGDDTDGLLRDANVVAVEARSGFVPRIVRRPPCRRPPSRSAAAGPGRVWRT